MHISLREVTDKQLPLLQKSADCVCTRTDINSGLWKTYTSNRPKYFDGKEGIASLFYMV